MDSETRVIVLIDMDCFYCQVEEKLNPELRGKPIAVVQYNPWKGGGIIAVNYVARGMGVTRHMRGDEAKAKCPEIELPSVPCSRGKADITKYRDAGKDVARVLQKFTPLLERASIDEAYLDITAPVQERLKLLNVNSITREMMPNTYALGYDSVEEFLTDVHNCCSDSLDFDYEHAQRLAVGAVIVSEIRAAVYDETGYRCSAGIAHNKILAKLVCGMNKPNKQTILPKHSIDILYKTLPVKKVKHLGGKFGDSVCEILGISKMAELQAFSEKVLQNKFDEKNGTWLYNIARGVDLEPVQARFNPKSIGCCKQFKGKAALLDVDSVRKWLKDLGDEIEDRLEKDALENNRTPKQMVVSYSSHLLNGKDTSSSRSYNFMAEDELCGDFFSRKAMELLMESSEGFKPKDGESNRRLKAPIKFLGISVGKFEDHTDVKKTRKINDYFGAGPSNATVDKPSDTKLIKNQNAENKSCNKENGKDYIMQKFLQVTDKSKENNPNIPLIESSLDKQESFFAKMLNKKLDNDARSIDSNISNKAHNAKPDTPVCEVNGFGEESNDSEVSGSTINNEINKSIALFEDDPNDIDRVDGIRQLMNNSAVASAIGQETSSDTDEIMASTTENVQGNNTEENDLSYTCSECGKSVPIAQIEMHTDYHLAVKLRDEERQLNRKENEDKRLTLKEDRTRRKPENHKKVESSSIANYLVKVDDTIPTQICSECGKKVAVELFLEHLDFHEAQKLNRELNRNPGLITANSAKRKRKSGSPIKKIKLPNCKSIDSFFK